MATVMPEKFFNFKINSQLRSQWEKEGKYFQGISLYDFISQRLRSIIEIYEFIFITFIVKTIHSFKGSNFSLAHNKKNAKKIRSKGKWENVLTDVHKNDL